MDYYTSDLHIGHKNIIRFCDRPFKDVDHMNEMLIKNINDTVTMKDRLIILGDIVMGDYEAGLALLERIVCGSVLMFPGNHDKWSLAYKQRDPARRQEHLARLSALGFNNFEIEGPPVGTIFSGVPDSVPSQWPHRLGKHRVLLSHYPYHDVERHEDKYRAHRPINLGLPLICGHVHESWQISGRQFNVGVDANDFHPVSEERLIAWIDQLEQ